MIDTPSWEGRMPGYGADPEFGGAGDSEGRARSGPAGNRDSSSGLQRWRQCLVLLSARQLAFTWPQTVCISALVNEAMREHGLDLPVSRADAQMQLSQVCQYVRECADPSGESSDLNGSRNLPSPARQIEAEVEKEAHRSDDSGAESRTFGRAAVLSEALSRLPQQDRRLLRLRAFDHLPFRRIAQAVGGETEEICRRWCEAVMRLASWLPGDSGEQHAAEGEDLSEEEIRFLLESDRMLEEDRLFVAESRQEFLKSDTLILPPFANRLDRAMRCVRWLRAEAALNTLPAGGPERVLERSVRWLGRYEILCELGSGGHASVFLSRDSELGRFVAVKTPRLGASARRDIRRRFEIEARAIAALNHPHIVEVLDFGQHNRQMYLVEAACLGPTLKEWNTARRTPVDDRTAACIARQLADAVSHAHSRNILHRDIKPANVLLDPVSSEVSARYQEEHLVPSLPSYDSVFFLPRLSDFGIARIFDSEQGEPLTATDAVIGTIPYIAPEHALGHHDQIGWATDVYGLGMVLYELLTRTLPFRGISPMRVLHAVTQEEPRAPSRIRSDVNRDLEAICLKCLEKSPAARYESAAALRDDLDRFLSGHPVLARPPSRFGRLRRWCRRHPGRMLAAGSAVVMAALLVLSVFWHVTALNREVERTRVQMVEAHHQRLRADQEADNAKRQTELAEQRNRRLLRHLFSLDAQAAWLSLRKGNWTRCDELLRKHADNPDVTSGFIYRFLWQMAHQHAASSRVSDGRVFCVSFSPDGKILAGGDEDGTVTVWNAGDLSLKTRLTGHTACVNALTFSDDGSRIFSVSCDGTLRSWNTRTWKPAAVLFTGQSELYSVASSPDVAYLAAGDQNGNLFLIDPQHGHVISRVRVSDWRIESLFFSHDGRHVVGASHDEAVVYQVPDLQEIRRTGIRRNLAGGVHVVHRLPTTDQFLWAGSAPLIGREPLLTTSGPQTLYQPRQAIHSLSSDRSGRLIAFAGGGRIAQVFDSDVQRTILRLYGHTDRITGISLHPDAVSLATSSFDGTVKLWKVPHRGEWRDLSEIRGARQLAFADAGSVLLITGSDGIRAFDVTDWTCRYTLPGDCCAVSCDETRGVVAAVSDGRMTLHRASDGTTLTSDSHEWNIRPGDEFLVGPSGSFIIGLDSRGWLQQVDLVHRDRPAVRQNVHGRCRAVCRKPRSDSLIVLGSQPDDLLDLAPPDPSHPGREMRLMARNIRHVRSHDRTGRIAAAAADSFIYVWDAHRSNMLVSTTSDADSAATCVAFSADGDVLAGGDEDGWVRLWETETGHNCLSIPAHRTAVTAMTFSPNGRLLVTAAAGTADVPGCVRVWKAASAAATVQPADDVP